jgi:hypothetical protein
MYPRGAMVRQAASSLLRRGPVSRERVPMSPGDLVLTPNWTWHDHANDTDAPMIWLDGLDTPLLRMLEAGFYEEYHQDGFRHAVLFSAYTSSAGPVTAIFKKLESPAGTTEKRSRAGTARSQRLRSDRNRGRQIVADDKWAECMRLEPPQPVVS